MLAVEAVQEIFLQRPPRLEDGTFKPGARLSHKLAAAHGVSERQICEIWNRRISVTKPLWTDEEIAASHANAQWGSERNEVLPKRRGVGRPKGSKNTEGSRVPAAGAPCASKPV
eukprot:CAMPEP_0196746204 /NCGR_PEP_ID=MMETSP1091-20130531/64997_1 /TAXON_ID=302021 /ORGANISM="Rhodomonas sp., Strain CCMP768" /LENGTH=113 /DNA_ID=CAMNT_0042093131 /DNA_START=1 /DNA_END=342 /DNA_ORIENTATION=+